MDLLTGSTYKISYTNSGGAVSEREITIKEQWTSYGWDYIKAYCWLKKDHRTFRVDRIDCAVTSGQPQASETIANQPVVKPSAPVYQQAKAARPLPMAVEHDDYKRPRGSHPVLVTLSLIFVIFAFYVGFIDESDSSSSYTTKTTTPPKRPEPVTVPAPVKTAEWEGRIAARKDAYKQATGFYSAEPANLYGEADTDFDNILSWPEISKFQNKIQTMYNYKLNDTALTPPDFIAQGGGDCEDWSLFTCGLLRFWGYRSYVGVVDGNGGGVSSHAITLFYKKTKPGNAFYRWYEITSPNAFYGVTLPAGYYLPIDYNHTGSFSNASKADTPLRSVYVPEDIYNRYM